ncbi:MAG TPA: hypothetical protein VEG27_11830 [Usitatibacter sp.]|nr:hypothetical protein [Usitatibacter sp.]
MKRIALIAAALAAAAALPAAADIYIIASPGLELTADEARQVFLGDKQFAGTVKIVPFDNAAAQSEFLTKVLDMSANRYNTLWAKKGFRDGLNPPAVKASDLEVLNAVKATPGAVGYVSSAPSGVTVVRKY